MPDAPVEEWRSQEHCKWIREDLTHIGRQTHQADRIIDRDFRISDRFTVRTDRLATGTTEMSRGLRIGGP